MRQVSARFEQSRFAEFFDGEWYDAEYGLIGAPLSGLAHYLQIGAHVGNSPNCHFDEGFYTALYEDVRLAVDRGEFFCGFEHYLLFGAGEGRLPKHEVGPATEVVFPGLTKPVDIDAIDVISSRLAPIPARKTIGPRSIWLLVPLFNPDLFFGGYKAGLELVRSFHREGWAVKIVICWHPEESGFYALWQLKQDLRFQEFTESVVIYNRHQNLGPLEITEADRVIAYSCWEAFLAQDLAKLTNEPRFILLAQEYEPIFTEYGSEHAILSSAYQLTHFPIFNSYALLNYFRENRIGIFRSHPDAVAGRDYAVFEHVLSEVERVTPNAMSQRLTRRFAMYARPEGHARRNLFALGILALRQAIDEGYFCGRWEFYGIGAANPSSIDLSLNRRLQLWPKMGMSEYRDFRKSIDVAMSLMYSPHPGLVAFEFAAAGARVVTNTFENRSDKFLREISSNIIPCEASIAGVVRGLSEACAGVDDFELRWKGTTLNRFGAQSSWDETFGPPFHEDLAGFLRGRK